MRISDWSSDVCSSDLVLGKSAENGACILDNVGHFRSAAADDRVPARRQQADAEHHKRSLGGDAGGGRRRAGHHGVRAFRVESVAESIVTTAGKHEPDLRKIGPSTVRTKEIGREMWRE